MSENGDRRIDEEEGEIENERDEDEDKGEIRDILDETIHDLRNVDSNLAVMSGEEGDEYISIIAMKQTGN